MSDLLKAVHKATSELKPDDVVAFLEATEGDVNAWHEGLLDLYQYRTSVRMGQLFYNCLHPQYQMILNGSLYDPFYQDSWLSVYIAIAYIMEVI